MSKKSVILMTLGLVFIGGAIFLTALNYLEEDSALQTSQNILDELEENISDLSPTEAWINEQSVEKKPEIKAISIDNDSYIGVISIPSLNISLPVNSAWSESLLKRSPCLYKGSYYDDNMIIAAHNYKKHFGKISKLMSGDIINFKSADGQTYVYKVTEKIVIGGFDVEGMESGDWDLSLFTCTYGGAKRITVRCQRQPEETIAPFVNEFEK